MATKTMTLHGVVSVEAREVVENMGSDGKPYYVRHFLILDEDGAELDMILFGNNKTNLQLEI
jgi:hypothetical protein